MTSNHVSTIFYFSKSTMSFSVYVRANMKTLRMYLRVKIKSFVSKKERKILEILCATKSENKQNLETKINGVSS